MKTLKFRDYKNLNENINGQSNLLYSDDPPFITMEDIYEKRKHYRLQDIFDFSGKLKNWVPQKFRESFNNIISKILTKYPDEASFLNQSFDDPLLIKQPSMSLFDVTIGLTDKYNFLSDYTINLLDSADAMTDIEKFKIEIAIWSVLNTSKKRMEFLGKITHRPDEDSDTEENFKESILQFMYNNRRKFAEADYDMDELEELESELLDACVKTTNALASDLKNILNGK